MVAMIPGTQLFVSALLQKISPGRILGMDGSVERLENRENDEGLEEFSWLILIMLLPWYKIEP